MNSAIQTTLFDDAFQSAKTNNSAVTNAPNYTGLNGDGYFVGGSGLVKVPNAPKVGIRAGVDGLIIPNPKKKTDKTAYDYSGGSVSLLVGSPGIEVHGGVGYTIAIQENICIKISREKFTVQGKRPQEVV